MENDYIKRELIFQVIFKIFLHTEIYSNHFLFSIFSENHFAIRKSYTGTEMFLQLCKN